MDAALYQLALLLRRTISAAPDVDGRSDDVELIARLAALNQHYEHPAIAREREWVVKRKLRMYL